MNTRKLALGVAFALAAAPALAWDATSRHPSGSSSSGSSSGGSSVSAPSSPSDSGGGSSSASERHPSSSGSRSRQDRGSYSGRHRGHGGVRVYGGYSSYGGYYPGYDYYGPYWGGYYGWRLPYSGHHYIYDRTYGALRLMVEPDDAEVYVDGYYAGDVDSFNGIFQRLNVRPGRHEIVFKRAGYRTHRIRVYVPVGSSLRIRYHMERGANLEPSEAVVGSPEQQERAERERREALRDDAPDAPELDVPARPGELRLKVKPADAAVYIDGVFRGNAEDVEELQLPPGTHRVEVVRPGYTTYEKDIALRPGQNVEQQVDLARKAGQD